MSRFAGKVALITGASSGIGQGVAQMFYEQGAKVILLARRQDRLLQLQKEMPGSEIMVADVRQVKDLQAVYAKLPAKSIDFLIANAGTALRKTVGHMSEEEFDNMADTNFKGLFFSVNLGVAALKDHASVVLISSVASSITIPQHSVYSATKAAVSSLIRGMALDLSPRRIRVNGVSPGFTETEIFDHSFSQQPGFNKDAMFAEATAKNPLGRIAQPSDIAQAVLFLCSEEASYITGTDLQVDGGGRFAV